jgi:hypothetical protein
MKRGTGKITLQMTRAMQAKATTTLPARVTKSERFLWNRMRQPFCRPADLTNVKCGLCWSTVAYYCPCGWELAAEHNVDQLVAFGAFAFAAKNPLLRAWDPEDQRQLLAAMRQSCDSAAWVSLSPTQRLQGVASLCCLAGLTGRASTVECAGAAAASMSWSELEDKVKGIVAAGLPVYRGGQHPGSISPAKVAETVRAIDSAVGLALGAALQKLTAQWAEELQARVPASDHVRREGILDFIGVVNSIAEQRLVSGISHYKAKRIVEMLQLAAYGGLASLYAIPKDLRVAHGVYPLPQNSMSALAAIFPTIRSNEHRRAGLRLLQKTLKPGCFDIPSVVAMLCFWTEQQHGVIDYSGTGQFTHPPLRQ